MKTKFTGEKLEMQPLGRRRVICDFQGGTLSSDGGGLLLREVESRFSVIARMAQCFSDLRDPALIEHTVEELLSQRIYGLALGYEDLNDHDRLRNDPLQGLLAGKDDLEGRDRFLRRDQGKACAGKSTLQRLERSAAGSGHYWKTPVDGEAVERLFVQLFIERHEVAPEQVILDIDPTDVELHGKQEGRHFSGHYDEYCYLPTYVFCGHWLLSAQLKSADRDASEGAEKELERVVDQLREAWPEVRVVVRADSAFAREAIMAWCESKPGVEYVFGLAKNPRLSRRIEGGMEQARRQSQCSGQSARVYAEFAYRTLDSWSRERRVIAKAEWTLKGANPRFLVTSLEQDPQELYEEIYCARGEMENRIKEQQLGLFSDRASAKRMRMNQLRIWLSAAGYWLMQLLREYGLKGTRLARAQCWSIRVLLLKAAARIRVTARCVAVSFADEFAAADVMAQAQANLSGFT